MNAPTAQREDTTDDAMELGRLRSLMEGNSMNNRDIFDRKRYERVVCADGASVSIQAGAGVYSIPRDNKGPYTHVEAGFPSVDPPPSWREYAEADGKHWTPCDTVYAYMPYDCVDEFINVHGGLMEGFEFELPPRSDTENE